MPSLFDPIQLGDIPAANRILMAPLTRGRATDDHVPTDIMVDYYRQRAGAGLIITEGTGISQEGLGWPNAPGLWTDEQVEAWKPVTAAVHEAGGKIVAQIWHMGRLSRPDVIGITPLSSSATRAPYHKDPNPYGEARAATVAEIKEAVEQYAQATRNALEAGFDGVQVHGANGYLIDQFFWEGTNTREDGYGGSTIAERSRFAVEVVKAVRAWSHDHVSVRLSPNGETQGVNDATPEATFTAAAALLDKIGIAFLELREPPMDGTFGASDVPPVSPHIRKVFSGPLVLNSDYDHDKAVAAMAGGIPDAISFGRTFLANPDLPARLAVNAPLNPDNPARWYGSTPEGYTDYPTMDEQGIQPEAAAAS